MPRTPRRLTAVAAVIALLSPSLALGQEPGVTFDDGPSSKEYAIPLEAARGQTGTKAPKARPQRLAPAQEAPAATSTATGGSTPAGEPARKAVKRRAAADAGKKAGRRARKDAAAAVKIPELPSAAQTRAAGPASPDGTGAAVVIGGLALAALVLGALAGLVLRRRRGPVNEH